MYFSLSISVVGGPDVIDAREDGVSVELSMGATSFRTEPSFHFPPLYDPSVTFVFEPFDILESALNIHVLNLSAPDPHDSANEHGLVAAIPLRILHDLFPPSPDDAFAPVPTAFTLKNGTLLRVVVEVRPFTPPPHALARLAAARSRGRHANAVVSADEAAWACAAASLVVSVRTLSTGLPYHARGGPHVYVTSQLLVPPDPDAAADSSHPHHAATWEPPTGTGWTRSRVAFDAAIAAFDPPVTLPIHSAAVDCEVELAAWQLPPSAGTVLAASTTPEALAAAWGAAFDEAVLLGTHTVPLAALAADLRGGASVSLELPLCPPPGRPRSMFPLTMSVDFVAPVGSALLPPLVEGGVRAPAPVAAPSSCALVPSSPPAQQRVIFGWGPLHPPAVTDFLAGLSATSAGAGKSAAGAGGAVGSLGPPGAHGTARGVNGAATAFAPSPPTPPHASDSRRGGGVVSPAAVAAAIAAPNGRVEPAAVLAACAVAVGRHGTDGRLEAPGLAAWLYERGCGSVPGEVTDDIVARYGKRFLGALLATELAAWCVDAAVGSERAAAASGTKHM